MSSRLARALLALVVLGALGGCKDTVAKETFARDQSCPLDRVVAKARPDLKYSDLRKSKRTANTPPPEVAADPARLAIWQKKEDESRTQWDGMKDVYEVNGCNTKAFYTCSSGGKSGRTSCSVESDAVVP